MSQNRDMGHPIFFDSKSSAKSDFRQRRHGDHKWANRERLQWLRRKTGRKNEYETLWMDGCGDFGFDAGECACLGREESYGCRVDRHAEVDARAKEDRYGSRGGPETGGDAGAIDATRHEQHDRL